MPFLIEAIEITDENIEEVAEMIGTLKIKGGNKVIEIDRRVVPNIYKAYVGWYLTKLDNQYRVYSPTTFSKQFAEPLPEDILTFRAAEGLTLNEEIYKAGDINTIGFTDSEMKSIDGEFGIVRAKTLETD